MTESRDMLSDELVEAMENLHLYPRLIAERAAKEARRAALASLRERVAGMERYEALSPLVYGVVKEGSSLSRAAVLAAIDRALGEP